MVTIGREVHTVKPSPENSRNSEGAFMVLNDGTIMYAYTKFVSSSNDDAEAEIYAVFSHDDGETWGEGRTIVKKRPGDMNIMSVSLLRLKDGAIALFFARKTEYKSEEGGLPDCLPNMCVSYDEGVTWSETRCCLDIHGYFVLNNDRVVRLKSGRVIMPVAFHSPECGSDHGRCRFFISDDDCKTFHEAKDWLKLPFWHHFTGLQEPGIVELKDGRLWCFARTGHGYQFEAYSEDEGETWSDVRPNEFFTSPNSPMSAKYLQNGKLLAVFNPIPLYNGRFPLGDPKAPHGDQPRAISFNMYHPFSVYEGRTPLVAAISDSGPKEFENELRIIENNPDLGYCYTAILPHKDYILFAYFVVGDDYGYDIDMNLYGIKIKKVYINEI